VPASESTDQLLASTLRLRREARGATQEEIAYAAGVTVGTLGQIERGQVNPNWMTVKRISEALDITFVELAALMESNASEQGAQ
jgi:transcriptional regulator with XRE-family HTH domain